MKEVNIMDKKIKIGEREYNMKSSALTQFSYKDVTGRSFLKDVKKLIEMTQNKNEFSIDNIEIIDDINNLLLPITYVMIKEADKTQVEDYDSFLGSIDNLYDDTDWIFNVILLACSPISRQLQVNNINSK